MTILHPKVASVLCIACNQVFNGESIYECQTLQPQTMQSASPLLVKNIFTNIMIHLKSRMPSQRVLWSPAACQSPTAASRRRYHKPHHALRKYKVIVNSGERLHAADSDTDRSAARCSAPGLPPKRRWSQIDSLHRRVSVKERVRCASEKHFVQVLFKVLHTVIFLFHDWRFFLVELQISLTRIHPKYFSLRVDNCWTQ